MSDTKDSGSGPSVSGKSVVFLSFDESSNPKKAQNDMQPEQGYAQPGQGYAQPGQGNAQPGQGYAQPGQGYAQPGQGYAQPGQGYAQPGQGYAQPAQGYPQPGQGYPQPGQGYAQPVQAYPQGQGIPPPTAPAPWQPGSGGPPAQGANNPDDCVDEDSCRTAPTAPPMDPSLLPKLPGYESVNDGGDIAPPPSYGEATGTKEPTMADYKDVVQLNEEDVREALLSYIAQNCCYGKGTAREMRINEIKLTSALHYVLESYCEKRLSSWHQDAYTGQLIDGPHNGQPPSVWQVPCTASNLFANESKYVEVPHTCTVMPCHLCHASGYNPCHQCMGRGWQRCSSCRGSGRGMHSTSSSGSSHCISCHGHGMKKCHTCQGEGMILCVVCQGYKQVRNYIRLKIDYTNHVSEYVIERTEMPDHLIKNVEGQVILQQQFAAVSPLIGFLDGEMVEASIKMINDDKASHANEYMLQQRQTLRAVPVSEVHCMWKGSAGQFWVYGNERKIHAPDYPDKCCCGCSVL